MKRLSLLLLVLLPVIAGLSVPTPSAAAEFRLWQGATGAAQLEARFVKFENGHAFLKTRDDRIVRVAPTELSSHDLDYLKILARGGDLSMLSPARRHRRRWEERRSGRVTEWKEFRCRKWRQR